MVYYVNTKRIKGLILKKGDKVYLLRKNIKITRLSNKLDHKKLGPYLINEVIGLVIYKLRLLEGMGIYLVFHVALLEPILTNAVIVPVTLIEDT
jgi:hypothetical protein